MFRRYWHVGLAIGITLLLAGIGLSVKSKPQNKYPSDQRQTYSGECAHPTIISQHITSGDDSAANDQPKTGKDSQFDLDRRSVEAAEKAARWTEYSVYAGAAGIAFVILTFAANAWATILMHKDFLANHRPKIRLYNCEFDTFGGDIPLVLKIAQVNVCESDAFVFNHNICLIYRERGVQQDLGQVSCKDNPKDPLTTGVQMSFEIETGIALTQKQFELIDAAKAELFLDITTHFRDGNSTVRFTDAIRKYHRVRRKFLKIAPDHEYAREDFEG